MTKIKDWLSLFKEMQFTSIRTATNWMVTILSECLILRSTDHSKAESILISTQFHLDILRTVRDLGHELSGNLLRKQHVTPEKWREIEAQEQAETDLQT